jgi:hypothetical protein
MKLYSDDNPKTTLKNTGYKNAKIAKKTINMISKRSIIYQKSVITTMHYRAKHHKNITEDMKKAMNVFKKWMEKNKTTKRKYDYLDIKYVKIYEKLADIYNVSRKTRGLEQPTKSDFGFLEIYKKHKGKIAKLPFTPIKSNKPDGQDYDSHRENFIKQRLGQIKKQKNKSTKDKLYYSSGKFKGLPTKQHVVLIMHAYTPDKKIITSKKMINLIKKL